MATNSSSCPRCGTEVPPLAKFCPSCGYATARLTAGQTLDGKYLILEKIGEGGMGEVYKARHLHLDEIRIIKVTKPDPLGEGSEPRRFQEEARIATLVRHPNVAALYDFSRLTDGSYYIVWEFIDGITLEEWLRRKGPLPAARALDVAEQVLAGLAQIHAQGIVHRDLSPDNIMLRETQDGRLIAKIIDLGIAKRVAAEALQMTGTGMFVGKLKYCSPEQAGSLPAGQRVDGRSDLYSFGAVLYEMLSGKPPFESQTPEGYLGQHLNTPAPPLDTTRLPESIGPGLASIVRRALEKNRDRRFRDAEEFSSALARLRPAAQRPGQGLTTAVTSSRGAAPYGWILGALLVIAIAAAFTIVNRAGSRPRASAGPATGPLPEPTARLKPTASVDEVVVIPRILEDTPVPTAVRSTPMPTHGPAAPAASVPTAVPTSPAPLPSDGEPLTEKALRRRIVEWTALPIDRRAHAAVRLAYVARHWIKAHPSEPMTAQLRETLPRSLKDGADTAQSNGRPGLAMEFLVAYLELNPDDTDALNRLTQLRERGKRPGPRQRRFPNE